jgi:hypothetical protein
LRARRALAEIVESDRGFWIDGESLLPLRFGLGRVAGMLIEIGEKKVRLDHFRLQLNGLLHGGNRRGFIA